MSILDKFDDLATASDNAIENVLIEKFLKENYRIIGYYTINNGIVDIKGSITVKNKKLTELTNGLFEFGSIYYYFDCFNCTSLTSLKGAPKEVGGPFICSGCISLTSLKGAPEEVGGNFDCSGCTSLTSLKGAPKEVSLDFFCSHCNSLTSLEGAPKKVHGWFGCKNCGIKFTKEQVVAVSDAKHIVC
jgi:hypothetical protein